MTSKITQFIYAAYTDFCAFFADRRRVHTATADDTYDSELQATATAMQEAMARYEMRMAAYY